MKKLGLLMIFGCLFVYANTKQDSIEQAEFDRDTVESNWMWNKGMDSLQNIISRMGYQVSVSLNQIEENPVLYGSKAKKFWHILIIPNQEPNNDSLHEFLEACCGAVGIFTAQIPYPTSHLVILTHDSWFHPRSISWKIETRKCRLFQKERTIGKDASWVLKQHLLRILGD